MKADLEASTQKKGAESSYILMEFNAWLYQGYEDARQALLQAVFDSLVEEAKQRKAFVEKVIDFAMCVKLLKVGRIVAPAIRSCCWNCRCWAARRLVRSRFRASPGLVQGCNDAEKLEENLKAVKEAYADLSPDIKDVLGEKKESALPREIEWLRKVFVDLLEKLDVHLVVFVDDLDRCLPNTAIATLEAMRLLLHVKRTAFIIAADESMIRGAVRAHFI